MNLSLAEGPYQTFKSLREFLSSRKWGMINEQLSMSNYQWPIINDQWSMTNDQLSRDSRHNLNWILQSFNLQIFQFLPKWKPCG
jgi:hypothetical protein